MLSVIIPVYNGAKTIGPLLDSLDGSALKVGEIIVVDDGSSDATADAVRRHPVRYVRMPQRGGPAAARNRGAREAAGDVLVFFDADVVVLPETLTRIAAHFEDPSCMAVTGTYHPEPLTPGFFPRYKALMMHAWTSRAVGRVSYFEAYCGAIRRDAFLAAGGFDARFRDATVEDYEFGYRFNRLHPIRFDPDLQVRHAFPTWRVNLRKYYHRAAAWVALFMRWRVFDTMVSSGDEAVSVGCAASAVLAGLAAWRWPAAWIVSAACAASVMWLKRRFFKLAWRSEGPVFAARAVGAYAVQSLAIVAGAAHGLLLGMAGKRG